MYVVTRAFRDSMDGDRLYRAGDAYPAAGAKPSRARINELLTGANRNGRPYIEERPSDAETEPAEEKELRNEENAAPD